MTCFKLLHLVSGMMEVTAGCDLPAARVPCGWGCSRAAPAVGGCRPSAGPRGRTPGETVGWVPGSWRGAWGPGQNTSAVVGADWPGGGPELLLLLLLCV